MLRERLKNFKLILASGSPRRQQFFKDLDLDFETWILKLEICNLKLELGI